MRKTMGWVLALLFLASVAHAQTPHTRELYRVHFFKAAPGKLPDLLEAYRNPPLPDNTTPRPMMFRHRLGDDWDVMVIYPLGAKASLDANPAPLPEAVRRFRERVMADYAWHSDIYFSGPPLAEVQKALAPPKDGGGIYVAAYYTALAGHHKALDDVLQHDLATARPGSTLLFEHVQGAPWEYLAIYRYASWLEWAAAESDSSADDRARAQGFADSDDIGLQIRLHSGSHHDNVLSREH